MIREILRMGDPRLLRIAKPVSQDWFGTERLDALVQDMFDTMAANDGIGLAAPQIGVDLQLVVFGFEQGARAPESEPVPPTMLINPVISPLSDDCEDDWEGCLSVPGLSGVVPRYSFINYRGFDAKGQPIDRNAAHLHARVVQHECDHLVGRLYPSRIEDFSRFGFSEVLFGEERPSGD